MKQVARLICLLALISVSQYTKAADGLQEQVDKALRLSIATEARIDSAYKTVIAYSTANPGKFDECENVLRNTVIPYAHKHKAPADVMARLYDELAQTCARQGKGRYADAVAAYKTGLSHAGKSGNHFLSGLLYQHYALCESKYGDVVRGYELTEKAISAYRKSGIDTDKRITRCLYMMAIIYLQLQDTDGLEKITEKLKAFAGEARPDNRPFVLYNLYSIQEVYFGTLYENAADDKQKKAYADSAKRVSLASISLLESNPEMWEKSDINISWNYYNRAVFFVNFNARPPMDSISYYLDKAVAYKHKGISDDNLEVRISASQLLAEAWMKNNNYNKAKEILLATIDMLDKATGLNSIIIDKIEIYKSLSEIARQAGHYKEALDYAETLLKLEKERYSDENTRAIKDLEVKYKVQETELALARSEAHRADILMWFAIALGLLMMGAIVFIVYADRQRRRRTHMQMEYASLKAGIGLRLTQQYIEGLENERQRMSRELHDGVCNDLMAIQMNIRNDKPIEQTALLLDNCRESIRRISHELMPPEFAYATLDEVVRFYVNGQAQANRGKIEMTYSSQASDAAWSDIDDTTALEIYRIVQEAVGNAVRHSGATAINISMTLDNDILTAEITDNGTYKSTGRKGLGLDSMRHRAGAVNGRIDITGSNGHGTAVRLTVKITENRN